MLKDDLEMCGMHIDQLSFHSSTISQLATFNQTQGAVSF